MSYGIIPSSYSGILSVLDNYYSYKEIPMAKELAPGVRVEVEGFKGKVATRDEVKGFFASSTYYDRSQDWVGITDEGTGIVHLFWKHSNPAKVAKPDSWPPKENDVWIIGGSVYHGLLGGNLVRPGGGLSTEGPETVLDRAGGKAELLYRYELDD